MDLVTLWFGLVVLCWVLFFVLEGFDFGVGMLAPLLGRDDHERGAAIRTIGPFWDGNEVWLVAAVGVTFAAFPEWYAALLSGLYLPMVLVLLGLAGRGVALEFRGKHSGAAWRRRCDVALALCSAAVVAVWGAVLSVFVRGLALGPDGEVVGAEGVLGGLMRTVAPVLTREAAVGAVLALLAALLLGGTFLALRTTGPVRHRALRTAQVLAVAAAAGAGGTAALAAGLDASGAFPSVAGGAAAALAVVGILVRLRREALAFAATSVLVAAVVVATLTAHGDVVLPSTLDPAYSLTRDSAAATHSALTLISWAGLLVLPGVVAYQAFSYWVFRRRVASERVATA